MMDGAKLGVLVLVALLVTSLPASGLPDDDPWPLAQDDAGSGQDAPWEPIPEVWIETGETYEGLLGGIGTADFRDHYAFWAEAGDVVHAKVRGVLACFRILDPDGEQVEKNLQCTIGAWDAVASQIDEEHASVVSGPPIELTLERTGVHYLSLEGFSLQPYAFSIGVNEEAPEPGYFGQPLPTPGPHAPDCHELFSESVCRIPADIEKVCEPLLADWICKTIPGPDRTDPLPPLPPLV